MRATGTVKWFNEDKGYGFIANDDKAREDCFVHYSGIVATGNARRNLLEGQKVEFEVTLGAKGAKAIDVVVLA